MKSIKDKLADMRVDSAYVAKQYKFSEEVPKRPNAMMMYKWLSKEIKEIDEKINDIEREHELHAVCKKGCSACCRQCIVVSMAEVLPIEIYIMNLSGEEREKLKRTVIHQCEELEEKGINKDSIVKCLNEEASRRLQELYFSLQKPCVFLSDEGCCDIHEIRPTACWKYREYGDVSNCEVSCFSDTSFDFVDWEVREFHRILTARPTGNKLMILPFAIRELMRW